MNTTRKRNKGGNKQTFCVVFVILGWPFTGKNLARDKKGKTLQKKGICCFLFFVEVFLGKQQEEPQDQTTRA